MRPGLSDRLAAMTQASDPTAAARGQRTPAARVAAAVLAARQEADEGFSRGILRAIVALRWLTATWATVGVLISTTHFIRPWLAWSGLGAIWLVTVVTTWFVRTNPNVLTRLPIIVTEFGVAAGALLVDVHAFTPDRAQSLAWAWPAAVILTAAIFVSPLLGVGSAIALGIASWQGDARNSLDDWGVAASSKTALYVLAALIAAYVARRLREAEREISGARTREELGRTLHDGVLQTLAAFQRRSTDPELAALAREQDRELRDFLFGSESVERTLPVALRDVAAIVRSRDGLSADVIVADDLPDLDPSVVEAVAGAVSEALTNAAKHAEADRVVVYAEPDDSAPPGVAAVFCSVKDNGKGFDVDSARRRQGLSGSIEGRMAAAGGRATVSSREGRGTEIKLWTHA